MQLIGMLDSPFVRRVAISLRLLGMDCDQLNWSVGKDLARILEFSPLGRVPALVLEDGTVLTDSSAILDYLDDLVGPQRALLPATGTARRDALQIMALALGAADKGREQIYEHAMRPAAKRHEPWVERCRAQMHGALATIESACLERGDSKWWPGERLSQADVTLACVFRFLSDTVFVAGDAQRYPDIARRCEQCEALPEFQATYTPFFVPGS